MSDKKNNFAKLFDYFNGDDEDSEVEIINYQDNYNKMIQAKNSKEEINDQINNDIIEEEKEEEKENPIISELYSNKEEEDEEDNDVFYFKEKKNNKEIRDENDFNNFKFTSFKPKITDSTNNENNNNDIIDYNNNNELNIKEKENKNNLDLKNEEIVYQKMIKEQNSFGNINDTFNRSTSLQTEKILDNNQIKNNKENNIKEEYKPEYLINSKIFEELENKENKEKKESKYKKTNKIEWKDKNVLIKRNIEQLKLYMKKNIKMKVNNENIKKPIELILYDDAIKKRQKNEKINRNTITEHRLNSNRNKINKISYQISMQKDDKKIESVIKKYSNNDELGIVDICLILQELKIFRKLLQNINVNKLVNITDINEYKNRISIVIKDNEIRKKKELDFLEQIWNLLSNQKRKINNDIFEGFLKILFSSLGNINDTCNIMKQYIAVAFFGEQIQDNLDNKIKGCIQNFFSLKQNIVAYKSINNHNDEKYKKIIKENEKNLTFCPNIKNNNDFVHRKKNFNFNTLYDRFLKKEKDKQNNLDKLRKEKIREEMKEVKKKPKISKYLYNNLYNEEIHEKLYNQGDYIRKKKQDRIEMKEKEEKEKLEKELKTYRLHFNSKRNRRRMAKSFDIASKPKGFDEYIIRNRKEILNKQKLKEMKEKIPCGENYEKLKKRTITPFNITDMKRKKIKKEENNDFFTMKIKIPNGQMKNLKIDIKSDPYKISNDFCKIYSIKDDVKQKLIKNIINCQNVFLKVKNGDVNFFDNYL